MRDDLFEQLVASAREGGAVLRGEIEPSRRFEVKPPDVKGIRANYGLSRKQFAALLGVSPKTLQNWEQGRRTPKGAARILLEVAATHPGEAWDAVRRVRGRQTG